MNFKKDFLIENIKNENFYIFKDFYEKPILVLETIINHGAQKHKNNEPNSLNGVKFLDLRHDIDLKEYHGVLNYFSNFTKRPVQSNFKSNIQKFFDKNFNNYKDNFWWPHFDEGWTAIIYLNEKNLLNIYESDDISYLDNEFEHHTPWKKRDNFKLIKQFDVPFNTAILFPAHKFLHGLGLEDDTYSSKLRINQAIFLN